MNMFHRRGDAFATHLGWQRFGSTQKAVPPSPLPRDKQGGRVAPAIIFIDELDANDAYAAAASICGRPSPSRGWRRPSGHGCPRREAHPPQGLMSIPQPTHGGHHEQHRCAQ